MALETIQQRNKWTRKPYSNHLHTNAGEGGKGSNGRTKKNRHRRPSIKRNKQKNEGVGIRNSIGRKGSFADAEPRSSVYSSYYSKLNDMVPLELKDKDVSSSQYKSQSKGIRNLYQPEMYLNPKLLTFVEAQRMIKLIIEDNMVFAFATDQGGSRFLQEHLKSASTAQLWTTFALLRPNFVRICEDVFGNYVAQEYLELGSVKLKSEIVKILSSSVSSLSIGTYGCRVVQKLLECVELHHRKSVAKQFEGSVIDFVKDLNGNHVVQKMIECLGSQEVAFIADEILGSAYSLAVHPWGCRIIQLLLEKVERAKAIPLLGEIKQHTIALAKNEYGNYIIQ